MSDYNLVEKNGNAVITISGDMKDVKDWMSSELKNPLSFRIEKL